MMKREGRNYTDRSRTTQDLIARQSEETKNSTTGLVSSLSALYGLDVRFQPADKKVRDEKRGKSQRN